MDKSPDSPDSVSVKIGLGTDEALPIAHQTFTVRLGVTILSSHDHLPSQRVEKLGAEMHHGSFWSGYDMAT